MPSVPKYTGLLESPTFFPPVLRASAFATDEEVVAVIETALVAVVLSPYVKTN